MREKEKRGGCERGKRLEGVEGVERDRHNQSSMVLIQYVHICIYCEYAWRNTRFM